MKLKEFDACRVVCEKGLAIEPAEELSKMLKELATMKEKEEEKRRKEEEDRERRLAPARAIVRELNNRGYRLGRPQFHAGSKLLPAVDKEGVLHFPVLMFYPEVMGHDTIEDFSENTPLGTLSPVTVPSCSALIAISDPCLNDHILFTCLLLQLVTQ